MECIFAHCTPARWRHGDGRIGLRRDNLGGDLGRTDDQRAALSVSERKTAKAAQLETTSLVDSLQAALRVTLRLWFERSRASPFQVAFWLKAVMMAGR